MKDKYEKRLKQLQKIKYGGEIWEFASMTTSYILPRLKAFKKDAPFDKNERADIDWWKTIDRAITAFELIEKDDIKTSLAKSELIENGLHAFAEVYQSLWW